MRVVLCPRCELNYITGNDEYCKVCMQELRGALQAEEPDLCSVCNMNPVLPGRDICEACLREMSESAVEDAPDTEEDRSANAEEIAQMDSISQMDDILPDVKSDDNKEYGSMENPMSLEDVREDEENEDDEDEEEDER